MPRLVLLYHKIIAGSGEIDDPHRISVSERNFADQIAVLRRRARIISLAEWLSAPVDDECTVLITFDDGYRTSLQIAQAALGEAGAKAVAFVCPGHIGMTTPFWWDRLTMYLDAEGGLSRETMANAGDELMRLPYEEADARSRLLRGSKDETGALPDDIVVSDWDDVRNLDPAVFDIAHHGFHHHCFSALSTALLDQEFSRATRCFLSHGVPVHRVLAYPFGFPASISTDQIRECVSRHFVAAFTSSPGIEVAGQPLNRLLSPRNYVEDWPADQFEDWLTAKFAGALAQ
jgi:peptidoglycan/xylan/chitin deacetylase (PgdA/CDA1 family)